MALLCFVNTAWWKNEFLQAPGRAEGVLTWICRVAVVVAVLVVEFCLKTRYYSSSSHWRSHRSWNTDRSDSLHVWHDFVACTTSEKLRLTTAQELAQTLHKGWTWLDSDNIFSHMASHGVSVAGGEVNPCFITTSSDITALWSLEAGWNSDRLQDT
jgi:hypothetical protein